MRIPIIALLTALGVAATGAVPASPAAASPAQASHPGRGHGISAGHAPAQVPHAAASVPPATARPPWPAPGTPAPAVPKIRWTTCPDDRTKALRCAQVAVPMDYHHQRGDLVLLDVAKRPARLPKRRIGSLFVNPGGPGGSAIERIDRFAQVLGPAITDRFDVVAMDPRGVGETSKARCWSTRQPGDKPTSFPAGGAQVRQWLAHDAFEVAACRATGKPVIDHVSTANVARDMDLIRQAVGDARLTFYGVSYGSVLGATYAAMFPGKVRTIIVDGVVDPVAWTRGYGDSARTVPVSVRTDAPMAAEQSLRALFAACRAAGAKRCPGAATVEAEWNAVMATLRRGPVRVGTETYTLPDAVSTILGLQYDPGDARSVIETVHALYQGAVKRRPIPVPQVTESAPVLGRVVPPTRPQPEQAVWWDTYKQQSVMCADSLNPSDPLAWSRFAASPAARRTDFTGPWLWQSSLCARWPGNDHDAYRGPFTVRPGAPILVVGNTHDNATPLSSARAYAAMVPGARLLTVDAFGHSAANQSRCASAAMRAYLLVGALPRAGTVCRADKAPF